ncbi:hypothetical protein C5167_004176 [Papaver somniferum]|nr:hypothetical protein C5167_004176 [Papaver somniferum]
MDSTLNPGELSWHLLLLAREVDPDNREVIRKEIIRRCPEFETELDENESNLIHLASEYGYAEIVKELIFLSTTDGRMSPSLCWDNCLMTPIDYAIMNGNTEVVQLLLENSSSYSSPNKMSMETPRPSDDVPTKVFETLNNLLMLAIQRRCWVGYDKLEKFLASDPLLFGSCPLQTQSYIWVLSMETDEFDCSFGINKARESLLSCDLQDDILQTDGGQVNIYPMHDVCKWGFIHIVKLILIYQSGSGSVCLLRDMDGNLPHHYALKNNRANAFKTLLEYFIIHGEFLSNNAADWECGDTDLDLLVDGYVKIVKELLCQRESKICFQKEFWEGKEYFVVIKCKKNGSTGTCFKYQDYIREVTSKTTNRTILSLSVDSRSIITLKVLIRSAVVRKILDVRDVNGNTVFDLLDKIEKIRKTSLMGFVHYERFEKVIWLLDAIEMGDYEAFSKLQAEDPLVLDYVCDLPLGGTLLHVAVRFGQLNDCTREIMKKRPLFASRRDHKARNPLHIASSKGNLETVKQLLTQFGFNQCFASTYNADEYTEGEFYGTPLDYAIQKGRIPVINELLSVWWKCVRVLTRETNSDLLSIAVDNEQLEALKMLMERYIEDELLKAKEVDGNPMSALADGYIEIVLKHLLSPKVNYSMSILEKNRVDGNMGTKPSLPLYFAAIKVTSWSTRKDNNIIDELLLSAYYPKYFREVTIGNKMVLHLSMDDENSVTLKLLLRSPVFYQLDCYGDPSFKILLDELKSKEVVENEMGTLIPIWSNNISDVCQSSAINVSDNAKAQRGEGIKTFHEGTVSEEQFYVPAKEDYENVKADHKTDNAKDDNEEQHEQEMLTDTNTPDKLDGDIMRNQDGISLGKGQVFASLDCAAIKGNTEL